MTLDELIAAIDALGTDLSEEQRVEQIDALLEGLSESDRDAIRQNVVEASQQFIDVQPSDMSPEQLARVEQLAAVLDALDRQANPAEADATDDEEAAEATEASAATAQPEAERELVAASAETNASTNMAIPLGQAAANAPAPTEVGQRQDITRHTVIAAGDLQGYRSGQELTTMSEIAAAVQTGMTTVVRSQSRETHQQLAAIKRTAPDHLTYRNENDWRKVDEATKQKNLPGGSLTAAGGWCAPSLVRYDTCPIVVSNDGMVDLPTITAERGGIKFSQRPDFSSFWGQIGFMQTETDAMAGVQKPCFEIPCPDGLSECRMDVTGICLIQPLLTERGWPEKVEEFVEYAMAAHAHWMNAERIRRMVNLVDYTIEMPAAPNPSEGTIVDCHGPGAFESMLSMIELQVENFRYANRLGRNFLLEGLAPYWLRGVLRADISKKLGIADRWGAAANAALDRWFADRGIRLTYVYDWQDALASGDQTQMGGLPPECWPEQVSILLYEPGAYFGLQRDVINMTGLFDRVDLQQNVYTRLFTEEGFQVCKRCGMSMLLTFNLCPNGLSGSVQRTSCSPDAAAAGALVAA